MRRILLTAAALILVQAILVALYAVTRDEPLPAGARAIERPAPELVYRARDGEGRLSALRGRPVLVHFWATWCPPCREELPSLLAWAMEKKIVILAVSVDRGWGAVRRFLGRTPPPPIVLAAPEAARAFQVARLPETFLVDSDGVLRLRIAGARRWEDPALRAAVLRAGRR